MLAHCRALADELPRGRLLPAAGGRRRRPLARVLGALRGDRERRRDQGRAVRPLPHARRRARRGRGRRAGADLPLHRQRRPHRARPDACRSAREARRAALRRRAARPLVGVDADGRRDARALPRCARPRRRACRPAGARQRRHRLQRRVLRRRQCVPRRDRGLPRGAAPAGPARGPLVPRPGGGPEPGPGGGDRPRLPHATPSSPTTRSWPRTSSAGWPDRRDGICAP